MKEADTPRASFYKIPLGLSSGWYNISMSFRKVVFAPEEYYHIYNRGNSKQRIFLDDGDYDRFVKLLYLCNSDLNINFRDVVGSVENIYKYDRGDEKVNIGAYCLMPNHFHILVREKEENNISAFMKKLATAYVMYFNKKYERTGGLFEGKFKAQHVTENNHLKYLFSYIYLNPLKILDPKWKTEKIKNTQKFYQFISRYPHSSYQTILNKTDQLKLLNLKAFPGYFVTPQEYKSELFDWLT